MSSAALRATLAVCIPVSGWTADRFGAAISNQWLRDPNP
jgi:hypothetical protein